MIFSYQDWLKEYRKDKYKIWVKITLSNDQEIYFCDYKPDWFKVKEYCKNHTIDVKTVGLQYRSNYMGIDTTDCDGVYLIKSLVCVMGGKSRETYTIGKIHEDIVRKRIFMTPELIEDRQTSDPVEKCFEQGLLYHNGKEPT